MAAFKKRLSSGGDEQRADHATTDPESEPLTEPEVVSAAGVGDPRNNLPGPGDNQNFQQSKTKHSGSFREQMTSNFQAPNSAPLTRPQNPRGQTPARHQRQPANDVGVANDFTPIEEYEEAVVEPGPGPSQVHRFQTPQATQEKGLVKNYQAKRRQDKENRASQLARPRAFIDPQEEAERIDFDEETQERQSQQVASRRPGPISRGKRPAPVEVDEDEDVSQDEGFQTDPRDIGNRTQRRPPMSVAPQSDARPNQPSPPKRARIASQRTRTSKARTPRGHSPESDSQEDNDPVSTNHTRVKAMAQRNVALARIGAEPRKRKPWTGKEEAQLQSLIADYGTSWAELKKMDEADGNLLADRDQVALKDKARNMKMAFLK